MIAGLIAEGDSLTFRSASFFSLALNVPVNERSLDDAHNLLRPVRSSPLPKLVGANIAVSGTRLVSPTNSMTDRLTTKLAALIVRKNANAGIRKYVLTLLAGTNPDTSNPTTHANNVATYAASAKALGVDKVLVGTLPSRTDGIIGDFDTSYQSPYNTIIKGAGWAAANNVDGIIDFASDPDIGGVGAADNLTYFEDKVHPTEAGYAKMAAIYLTAINTALAAL